MVTSKELRELREQSAKKIEELSKKGVEEKDGLTEADDKTLIAATAEYEQYSKKIALAMRAETVAMDRASGNSGAGPGRENRDARKEDEREDGDGDGGDEGRSDGNGADDWGAVGLGGPATMIRTGTAEQRATAMQAWMRAQQGYELTKRHLAAVKACGVNVRARYLDIPISRKAPRLMESRALSSQLGTAGAYTEPEGFMPSFEQALLQFGGIRDSADIMRTANGNPLPWPTSNDTSNKGALLGENTAVATNVDPTFGIVLWNAYKFTSKMILVPVELMEDSAFDLPTIIGAMCGERIGRSQSDYFTTGTGASQPTGIVTAATVGVTTASATAIKYDELVDLVHSVDPAYRTSPSVGFMFHDLILSYLSKLKDGQGRPIWDNSQQGSLGASTIKVGGREYKFTINQSMDSTVATTKKTVLFGDFSKYKIRDVASVRLRRLVERYADSDQEGFVAFARADGNLLDAGTHPVSVLKQA